MCGILFTNSIVNEDDFSKRMNKMHSRGPDSTKCIYNKNFTMGQCLLSFRNLEEGKKMPYEFIAQNGGKWYLASNAEIYNQKLIRNDIRYHWYTYQTKENDGEVIFPVMCAHGFNGPRELDGQFSYVLTNGDTYYIARDPYGITSLYYGFDLNNNIWVSSEMKCIYDVVSEVLHVPPGHVLHNQCGEFIAYKYNIQPWMNKYFTYNPKTEAIYEVLKKAVKKRLQSDSEVGLYLSGGLDSSIVAAIAQEHTSYQMKSFSVGFSKDSPDLINARNVAKHIGTNHHELVITEKYAIGLLPEVINAIETFDVTTVRASVPMYALAKYMHSNGVRCALSGEGSDEIFGGYLYFHNTSNQLHFHKECVRLLDNIHMFDCLRAHKSSLASSVEVRVPFLDKNFVNYIMNMNPAYKCCSGDEIEKKILRQSIPIGMLPDDILWRQKEQFSDGVGYSWIDELKNMTESAVSDSEFNEQKNSLNVKSKEEFYYRKIYDEMFPEDIGIKRWIPRTDWDGVGYDPSGRAQGVHTNKYN